MAYTFKGGIHVDEHKHTSKCETVTVPTPPVVKISMNQSIGAVYYKIFRLTYG